MKYSVDYSNRIKMNDFDEIRISCEPTKVSYLEDFLSKWQEKEIVVVIKESDIDDFYYGRQWEPLNALYSQYKNFSVCICALSQFHELKDNAVLFMNTLEAPVFTGLIVTNFDELEYIIRIGAKQVYLSEEICFDLKRAKRVCDRHGVTIRAFPNVAQGSVRSGPAHKKFFIRPEDVEFYSQYIDTLEFWGPLDRQEMILNIYKDKYWFGDLKDLILGLNLSIDSMRILPTFATLRANCNRKCTKGGFCSACDSVLNIEKKLKENNLIIETNHPL